MIRVRIALAGGCAGIMWIAGGHGVAVWVVRVLEFVVGHGSSLLGSNVLTDRKSVV